MVEAAAKLASGPALRLAHQTGERDLDMVRTAYGAAGLQAEVEPFFYDMGRRVHEADLIVCRAGATTIAELTAAGKAAILIPLPTATDDHQRKNAEALAAAHAAEVLLQTDANGRRWRHGSRRWQVTSSGARGSKGARALARQAPRRSSSIDC
jgi:UDP-N-acetylglucosamine--N-acetylmuramyl-(pentapeptide) pyrophosphoryl-undecaprenol N-acetylglucosamine transferase